MELGLQGYFLSLIFLFFFSVFLFFFFSPLEEVSALQSLKPKEIVVQASFLHRIQESKRHAGVLAGGYLALPHPRASHNAPRSWYENEYVNSWVNF